MESYAARTGGGPELAAARRALQQAIDISGHLTGAPRREPDPPPLLDALREFTRALGPSAVDVRLEAAGDERLLADADRRELLLVVREALRNSFRHARADHITVALRFTRRSAHATVIDDGIGFDTERLLFPGHRCPGLRSMADRTDGLGGRLTVESVPGNGTRIDVHLPLCPQ
ncbi:sensor histidine kinase [Streptomyces sp. ERV7]|uniref:sensor histidine kinase n=1 Tax=Streptomyces sp. ERV7 TaxID=1322334 RepID=UPI0009A0253E|nr:ATP-binding protein [Streptomyces sp. ERV7]